MKRDCIRAIKASARAGEITNAAAKEIIDRIGRLAKQRADTKAISVEAALKEVAGELKLTEKTMSAIDQRNKLLSVMRKRDAKEHSKRFAKWGDGLIAYLVGNPKDLGGSQFSIHSHWQALRGRYLSRLFAEFKQAGVLDDFKKGRHSKEFYLESHQLSLPNGQPGITNNPAALTMAKTYRAIRQELSAKLNLNGAFIEEAPGYILAQSHDIGAIQALGRGAGKESMDRSFQAWYAFVLPRLDPEKTFEGMPAEKFLRNVHQNLYTGDHQIPTDELDVDAFKTHGSLANKVSSGRVLWFKDGVSAFEYNERFGTKDFNQAIVNDIHQRTRNIALMERLGPNPENTLKQVIAELTQEAKTGRDDSAAQVRALSPGSILGRYAVLSGQTEITTRPTATRIMDNIRAWRIASSGGKMLFSSFSDIPLAVSEQAYQGIRALDAFGQQIAGLARGRSATDDTLLQLGLVPNSLVGNVASRWGIEARTNYGMSGWLNKFFDLNLLNWWTDTNKATMADATAGHIASHAHLPMEQLPEKLARLMRLYDIDSREWEAIRKTAYAGEEIYEGFKFITADQFDNIPEATLDRLVQAKNQSPTAANRKRKLDELRNKYGALIVDRVTTGVIEPGARERYYTTWGGLQRGTFGGEMASMVMTYKSFPLAVTMKILGREYYGRGAAETHGLREWLQHRSHGVFNILGIVAATGIAGYAGMIARDLMQGRTPKRLVEIGNDGIEQVNWPVFFGALHRGGGLGIYGDFLFGEYDRQYRNALGALAGPVVGQLDPLLALGSKGLGLAQGREGVKAESFALDLERFAEGNIPFGNLFYIKPLADYLIWWHIQEALSPGVLRRREKNIREHSYQEFLITPSEVTSN